MIEVGKIVGEKVKGALTSNPKPQGDIDMSQFDAKDVKKKLRVEVTRNI